MDRHSRTGARPGRTIGRCGRFCHPRGSSPADCCSRRVPGRPLDVASRKSVFAPDPGPRAYPDSARDQGRTAWRTVQTEGVAWIDHTCRRAPLEGGRKPGALTPYSESDITESEYEDRPEPFSSN